MENLLRGWKMTNECLYCGEKLVKVKNKWICVICEERKNDVKHTK